MLKENRKFILISVCALFFFILDRALKFLALNNKILFIKNYNLALSINLNIDNFIILFLYLIIFIILVYYLIKSIKNKNIILVISFLFLIIGIVSNFLDRLKFGFIIDYINSYFFYNNLADIYIFFGIVLFLLKYRKQDK